MPPVSSALIKAGSYIDTSSIDDADLAIKLPIDTVIGNVTHVSQSYRRGYVELTSSDVVGLGGRAIAAGTKIFVYTSANPQTLILRLTTDVTLGETLNTPLGRLPTSGALDSIYDQHQVMLVIWGGTTLVGGGGYTGPNLARSQRWDGSAFIPYIPAQDNPTAWIAAKFEEVFPRLHLRIVEVSQSGSTLAGDWAVGGTLRTQLVDAVTAADAAIGRDYYVWHIGSMQGQGDAVTGYETGVVSLVEEIRTALSVDNIPYLPGRMGPSGVQAAQVALSPVNADFTGISLTDYQAVGEKFFDSAQFLPVTHIDTDGDTVVDPPVTGPDTAAPVVQLISPNPISEVSSAQTLQFSIRVSDAASDVSAATLLNGFYVQSPTSGNTTLTPVSVPTVDAPVIDGVWSFSASAFTDSNNGTYRIFHEPTIADTSGNALGGALEIGSFDVNIPGVPLDMTPPGFEVLAISLSTVTEASADPVEIDVRWTDSGDGINPATITNATVALEQQGGANTIPASIKAGTLDASNTASVTATLEVNRAALTDAINGIYEITSAGVADSAATPNVAGSIASGTITFNIPPVNTSPTVTFLTSATSGAGTFEPTLLRQSDTEPLTWQFPDNQNTLGAATHTGPLPAGFTFLNAGSKTVSVSTPETDNFTQVSASSCNLIGAGLVINDEAAAALAQVYCQTNNLTSLTLPAIAPVLTNVRCQNNSSMTTLILPTDAPTLANVWCFGNNLSSLALPAQANSLTRLWCYNNSAMSSLTLPNALPVLRYFICYNSNLSSLDLPTSMPALQLLRCSGNNMGAAALDAIATVLQTSLIDAGEYQYQSNPGTGTANTTILDVLQTAPKAWTLTPQH